MKNREIFLLFTSSIIIYSLVFDLSYLNIFNINWLYGNGEYQAYQIAFEFYKDDIWRWPITSNPNYGVDINNNIILSDNITFLNIIFKFISKFITSNFQFYGPWVLICLFLQSFFSYKVFFYYTQNIKYSFICSIFFIILPILLDRIFIHFALSAHWLVLWSFYLAIKDVNKNKFNYKWLLIFTIALLTNIYFFIVVMAIFSYSYLVNGNYNLNYKIKILAINYFYCLLILYLIGFFNMNVINYIQYGFGFYKSNLLTFFDSTGGFHLRNWSLLNIFDFKSMNGEEEGFGYLGLGGIVLFFILIYNLIFQKNKNFYKIFIFASIFFLIAISNNIHFANYNLINIDLNKYLLGIFSFIRSSGRYISVVCYIICISSFVLIYKYSRKINPLLIATVIIAIQLIDISGIFFEKNQLFKKNYNNLKSKFWDEEIYDKYKSLLYSYPSSASGFQNKYIYLLNDSKFKNTNITYQARIDQKKLAAGRYNLYKKISNKTIKDDELIIIDPNHLIYIHHIYKDENYGIVNVDDVWLLIKNKKKLMSQNDFQKLKSFLPRDLKKNIKIDVNKVISYLGFGWYKSKSLWSEGYESSIIFIQNENFHKILISCEIFNYDEDSKNLTFKINKKEITDVKIIKKNNEYLIELNVQKLTNQGTNILEIFNNNNISRMDLLIAPDGRILGLKLKDLMIN